jgi:carboxyl-terminal processing protease
MRLSGIGLLAAVAVLAPVALSALTPSASAPDETQGSGRVGDVDGLAGVWRSRGYGWLIEIKGRRARFYDEGTRACIRHEDTDVDLVGMSDKFEVSADGRTLRMPIEDPAYLYTFDRIEALPKACGNDPDAQPGAVLDAALELFSTHYAFFQERNVDWHALADTTRRQLSKEATDDQLLEVIGSLVSSVDDAHVSLEGEHDGDWLVRETGDGPTLRRVAAQAVRENVSVDEMRERWHNLYWGRDMEEILDDDEMTWSMNDTMVYGLVGEDIGYIALATMEGYARRSEGAAADIRALDRAMERVLDEFGDVDAVILDISMNDGGYDMVARALAGRFAAQRAVGYYKYAGDAAADEPQAIHVEPSDGRRFTGPVYLLTSDYTMSAAEILTMSMRALPNVTHVGQTTRGTLSDVLSKPLPNGWSLNLSNEIYIDADGRRWEGVGIPPQIALDVFSAQDPTKGHVEAVRAIVAAIRSGTPISLSSN